MGIRDAAFIVPFSLVLAACSFQASCGGKKLDTEKGEKQIAERISQAAGLPAKVDCPESKQEKGLVFECTTEVDGVKGRIRVTQTDDDGNVRYEPTEGYLFATKLEPGVAEYVKAQTGVESKVSCGARVHVAVPGHKVRCTATAPDGDTLPVDVTVKTADGSVDLMIAAPPPPAAPPTEAPTEAPTETPPTEAPPAP